MAKRSYYAILGVTQKSDDVVIQAAFKAMMKKYHPDTNKSQNAHIRATELNEAFEVLGNPEKRARYDLKLKAERLNQQEKAKAPPPPPPPSPPPKPDSSETHYENKQSQNKDSWLKISFWIATEIIGFVLKNTSRIFYELKHKAERAYQESKSNAAPPPPPPPPPQTSHVNEKKENESTPDGIILALAFFVFLAVFGFLLIVSTNATSLPSTENVSASEYSAPPLSASEEFVTHAESVARAMQAAFGVREKALIYIGNESVLFEKPHLIESSFGFILITEGAVQNASHASTGKIAIHYLSSIENQNFEVKEAFVPAVEAGSYGGISEWSVRTNMGNFPVIDTEGGGTWQGYTCGWATLTELNPEKPIELVKIPISYSYWEDEVLAQDVSRVGEIEGKIANIITGESFDVIYTGTDNFVDHYVRSGDAYVLTGQNSRIKTC